MTKDLKAPTSLILPGGSSVLVDDRELAVRLQTAWKIADSDAATSPLCTLKSAAQTNSVKFISGPSRFDQAGRWIDQLAVDFKQLGPGCELEVYPGLEADALLPWINLLLPAAGITPLHASAFRLNGCTIAFTGFAHSGKTGLLLAAAAEDADAIGDECVWLSADGGLHGLNMPAEIQLKYADEFPALRASLPRDKTRKARQFSRLARGLKGMQPRLASKLADRAKVPIELDTLFGKPCIQAPVDRLFLSAPHSSDAFEVLALSKEDALARLVEIQWAEYRPHLDHYAAFRYFFPGQANTWLDDLSTHLHRALDTALGETPCHLIHHPYPLAARDMLDTIRQSL